MPEENEDNAGGAPTRDTRHPNEGKGTPIGEDIVGQKIDDRYVVDYRIAKGGMGEIYFAQDNRLHRPVAMKVLNRDMSTGEWEARFQREARVMSGIEHRGIVPIYDLGRLPDGRLYYTMKHVSGKTLDVLMAIGETQDKLLDVLIEVCEIVHVAHDAGIVHRDLKPANIMMDEKGRTWVLDWGIARVVDEMRRKMFETQIDQFKTTAAIVIGSLAYMPPEQARGDHEAIDARSDVFSLGAIMYEVLVRRPPTDGTTTEELLDAATTPNPDRPSNLDPRIPGRLEAICMKAMKRRPSERYQNAKELAEALLDWRLNPDRDKPGTVRKILDEARKNPIIAVIAVAAVLIVLLLVWLLVR